MLNIRYTLIGLSGGGLVLLIGTQSGVITHQSPKSESLNVKLNCNLIADIIVQFEHFYFAPFLDPFCVTPSKIVVYNRWKMRTKTITIQQLLPGLAWGEISVEIALTTVYSSCECLSLCWCHFSLQDLPRKECQFRYCTEHETFSLLNGNQTRWRLFSFDFWIWNEGLLIGWI